MPQSSGIVLELKLDALSEDAAREEFFASIPGFFDSEPVHIFREDLSDEFRIKFSRALNEFLDRTFSFNSITESVRGGRLVICLNAAHSALGSEDVSQILWDIHSRRWPELLQSVETGNTLRRWSDGVDGRFALDVRKIVAQIVVGVRERDERWISLVKTEYGIPEHALRDYIGNGDSVLLSILIYMTRQAFHTGSWTPWVLSSLSGFNIDDTLPGLQHVFCDLWNDILLQARDLGEDNSYVYILREIRRAYIDLHRRTDAVPTFSAATFDFDPVLVQPRSYRYCNIASHRQDWANLTVRTPVTHSTEWPDALPSPLPQDTIEHLAAAPYNHPRATPHRIQGFTWSSPTAEFVHIHSQPPSISSSSLHESIRTAITLDPALLVPREASPDPHYSAPSDTDMAATVSVGSDDPTPQVQCSASG